MFHTQIACSMTHFIPYMCQTHRMQPCWHGNTINRQTDSHVCGTSGHKFVLLLFCLAKRVKKWRLKKDKTCRNLTRKICQTLQKNPNCCIFMHDLIIFELSACYRQLHTTIWSWQRFVKKVAGCSFKALKYYSPAKAVQLLSSPWFYFIPYSLLLFLLFCIQTSLIYNFKKKQLAVGKLQKSGLLCLFWTLCVRLSISVSLSVSIQLFQTCFRARPQPNMGGGR